MARWIDIESEAGDLAAKARRFFDGRQHKALATLRRDGSPRISGTECLFKDGDLWFGGIWMAKKALDLRRDPRFSLHSGSDEPDIWEGDAKVSGTVTEVLDPDRKASIVTEGPPGPFHLFRAEVTELVVVTIAEDKSHLVIEAWHEGRGITRSER